MDYAQLLGSALLPLIKAHGPGLLVKALNADVEDLRKHVPGFLRPWLTSELVANYVGAQVESLFPGITAAQLRKGVVPVSTELLTAELGKHLWDIDGLEGLTLATRPGTFLLDIRTSRLLAKNRILLPVACDDFSFSKHKRLAHFRFHEDFEITGRNLLGSVVVLLAETIIRKAVASPERREPIRNSTGGALDLKWPVLAVGLDNIPAIKAIADARLLGVTLLDLVDFHRLEPCDGYVNVYLRWAPEGSQATPVVRGA